MIHRIYFILLLLSLSFTAKAQLGKELIPNGGFEEYAKVTPPPSGEDDEEDEEEEPPGYFDPYQKPLYWSFNSSLFYTRIKDAHSGVFAVKVYPNGGSFFSRDENFNPYHIAIEAGGEYRLTYWYKGNVKNPNITVTVDWYKGTTSIKKETRDKEKATDFSDQWQQKTFTFKAPAGGETLSGARSAFQCRGQTAAARNGAVVECHCRRKCKLSNHNEWRKSGYYRRDILYRRATRTGQILSVQRVFCQGVGYIGSFCSAHATDPTDEYGH